MEKELRDTLQELIELEMQAEKFVKSAPEGKLRSQSIKVAISIISERNIRGRKREI